MAYLLDNCLILHIPKTGSNWVRAACQASVSSRISEIGLWHCDMETAQSLLQEQGKPLPFIGTFARHPLEWYRSAWLFWRERGRFHRDPESAPVESDEFPRFVNNCLAVAPDGYVSSLYRRFTGTEPGDVSFVGRQEQLADDLVRLLKLAGVPFDERKLRATAHRNVGGQKAVIFPGYSIELAGKVIKSEQWALKRFGYSD